jgi:hypothetical protein
MCRLVKAGALGKEGEEELGRISASAELIGYAASIWLSLIKVLRGHALWRARFCVAGMVG